MKKNIFPIFLESDRLNILLVGGNDHAYKYLKSLKENSGSSNITLVSENFNNDLRDLATSSANIEVIQANFDFTYTSNKNIVLSFISEEGFNHDLMQKLDRNVLFFSFDFPQFSNFRIGSVIQNGEYTFTYANSKNERNLHVEKLLIDLQSDPSEEVLDNLYEIETEEEAQNILKEKQTLSTEELKKSINRKVKKTAIYSLIIICSMLLGHILLSYIPFQNVKDLGNDILANLDDNFWIYILGGFIAQMIDGALGMAYGVSVTTFLLSLGLPAITPAVASASMHASEIFTTGSSSLVYMRHKNINMKLFKILVWPGLIGTILGVVLVSFVSKEYFSILKPFVAIYTLVLGSLIIYRTLYKPVNKKKIKKITPVAFFGGFLDSVGGGGWGPIVTTSLLAGGRHLRYAVGSAHLAKFFVACVSTLAFFITIGISHWQIIFGLVIGGMIAAPISIYFSTKIPIKKGLILVGILIVVISLRTLIKSLL